MSPEARYELSEIMKHCRESNSRTRLINIQILFFSFNKNLNRKMYPHTVELFVMYYILLTL